MMESDPRGWSGCWGGLSYLTTHKRRRYQKPAMQQLSAGTITVQNLADGVVLPDVAPLSPLMKAPPPSPVSLHHLHKSSSSKLSAPLTSLPWNPLTGSGANGSYSLEPLLETPPLQSASTTAPTTPLSTAPFTPPPELSHLTTPPSPQSPSVNLLAPFLSTLRPLSVQDSTQTSTDMFSPNVELEHYQPHNGSSVYQVVSPTCGVSRNGFSLIENVPLLQTISSCPVATCSEIIKRETLQGGICCSMCEELASKCNNLADALQQTQEKLVLLGNFDEREKSYRELIQKMQQEEKYSQAARGSRASLSKTKAASGCQSCCFDRILPFWICKQNILLN